MQVNRRWLVVFFFVFLAVCFCQIAFAGPGDTPATDYKAGVWREGKAVFSDVWILDIFNPHPDGFAPEQPIKYSHRLHAGELGIECQYCHSGVNKSNFATVPGLETCMGCHKLVKTDSPEIQKMADAFAKGQPIIWEPVNHLPEHSNFNHERHVKAGVGCQNCHGQVQQMDVVEKVSSLKMGFCISCHREQGVSIDCSTCHY